MTTDRLRAVADLLDEAGVTEAKVSLTDDRTCVTVGWTDGQMLAALTGSVFAGNFDAGDPYAVWDGSLDGFALSITGEHAA